jgi:hypothetical protein
MVPAVAPIVAIFQAGSVQKSAPATKPFPGHEERGSPRRYSGLLDETLRIKETAPARGYWGRIHRMPRGKRNPVVHGQVIPRPLVIGSEANDETRLMALRWGLELSHQPTVGFA